MSRNALLKRSINIIETPLLICMRCVYIGKSPTRSSNFLLHNRDRVACLRDTTVECTTYSPNSCLGFITQDMTMMMMIVSKPPTATYY